MKSNDPRGLPEQQELAAILGSSCDKAAVRLACRAFCEYDKGTGGEEGCAGLAAVGRALEEGVIGKDVLLPLAGQPPGPARRVPALVHRLCGSCSHRADGCDFMAASPPAGATPCGGYRLLQALLDRGFLGSV